MPSGACNSSNPLLPTLHSLYIMKAFILLLPFALFTLTALSACGKKTLGDKVDDALDQRPGEKVRDAVEDVTKK